MYFNVKQVFLRCRISFIVSSMLIVEVLLPSQEYRLVLTGHSLGAGVASLLAIILKKSFPPLICFAYSTPGWIVRLYANFQVVISPSFYKFHEVTQAFNKLLHFLSPLFTPSCILITLLSYLHAPLIN